MIQTMSHLSPDTVGNIQTAYLEPGLKSSSVFIPIWYDEDVHDLRSIETEFPAIIFNDNLTSNETVSCEPTVGSLNNNKIDFGISFDESDDEDYTVVFDKNSFSYKIISTNDLKTDSENDNEKVNMPLFPSPEPSVSCIDDLDFFKDFENEFPAIVYNDALTSKSDFSTEPTLCPQHIDEFDLKDETSLSEYDEVEQNFFWREDGYCNGGNLPGAYIVGNSLNYQDFEWYEALKDSKLKDEALRNKAIMEGLINEDDESNNEGWKRWNDFEITNDDRNEWEYENEHEDDERYELCGNETHELPVYTIRRFEIIKYSFGQDEEYVAVKEDKYEDLMSTSKDACQAYQEIFRMMDEGWMVTRAE
ncbi:hypothetical protein Tco_0366658 [Tanacetum coccineum]